MKFLFKKNNGKIYYVSVYYDVIFYIHHRRKRHFEEIVDSYKVINILLHFGIPK